MNDLIILTNLQFDLLEASKAIETFDVDDIRNMFAQAYYLIEFDNDESCYYAYETDNVDDLINSGINLVESLRKIK